MKFCVTCNSESCIVRDLLAITRGILSKYHSHVLTMFMLTIFPCNLHVSLGYLIWVSVPTDTQGRGQKSLTPKPMIHRVSNSLGLLKQVDAVKVRHIPVSKSVILLPLINTETIQLALFSCKLPCYDCLLWLYRFRSIGWKFTTSEDLTSHRLFNWVSMGLNKLERKVDKWWGCHGHSQWTNMVYG